MELYRSVVGILFIPVTYLFILSFSFMHVNQRPFWFCSVLFGMLGAGRVCFPFCFALRQLAGMVLGSASLAFVGALPKLKIKGKW